MTTAKAAPNQPGGEFRNRAWGEMNEAVIETVQTLCREGNRDSVLTVFQNFPEHFSCIPLNDSNVEPKQAINDLLRENVRDEKLLEIEGGPENKRRLP